MSEPLSPGDLCVIVNTPHLEPTAVRFIGRTVVLIREVHNSSMTYTPFWVCSGMPPNVVVSYICLRKIPPEKMLDARTHLEPKEVTC